ncbi:hypothetical protein CDEF62S_05492 [Castellaniella defragrans]
MLRLFQKIDALLLLVLTGALSFIAILGFAQVIWRYLLDQPLIWSEEVMRYSLIWIVFLGAGPVISRGQLAAVEFVSHAVPVRMGRLIRLGSALLCCIFWAVLVAYGTLILSSVNDMHSGTLEIPMSYVYAAIPLGAAWGLVSTLVSIVVPPTVETYND